MAGIIGGALMGVVGLGSAVLELGAVLRIWSILRKVPTAIARLEPETEVAVRGRIERAVGSEVAPLHSGPNLVWQHVVVQELTGRRASEPVNQTTGVRFTVRDETGVVEVDGSDAVGHSTPLLGSGRATPRVLAFAGDVFAWPNTIKNYFERGLRVGDPITVTGRVEKQRRGLTIASGRRPLGLLFGEPNLFRTEEARVLGRYVVMIPGGAAIAGVSYLVLRLASSMH